jgi:hypothetical protein
MADGASPHHASAGTGSCRDQQHCAVRQAGQNYGPQLTVNSGQLRSNPKVARCNAGFTFDCRLSTVDSRLLVVDSRLFTSPCPTPRRCAAVSRGVPGASASGVRAGAGP